MSYCKESHCVHCGHFAFEHEIAISTPQTGRCMVCGCPSLESPSKERMWKEIAELTTKLSRYEAMMAAAIGIIWNGDYGCCGSYQNKSGWVTHHLNTTISIEYPSPLEAFEALQKERV